MSEPVWREELDGASLGVFFMAVFAFVWASLGTSTLSGSSLYLISSAAISLALVGAGFYLRRAARSAPSMPQGMMRPGVMKKFRTVFLIEGIAVAAAVVLLGQLGYPQFIPSVVALIVGLHFFPLAPLFRVRAYYLTGALLCLVFLLTLLIAGASGSESLWFVVPGIGSALVLWATGIFLAVSGIRRLHGK